MARRCTSSGASGYAGHGIPNHLRRAYQQCLVASMLLKAIRHTVNHGGHIQDQFIGRDIVEIVLGRLRKPRKAD